MSQGERVGVTLWWSSWWAWPAEGGLPAEGAGDIGGEALGRAFKFEVRGGEEEAFGNT